MKLLLTAFCSLALAACATPNAQRADRDREMLIRDIDKLCACIGATRSSGITSMEQWPSGPRRYHVHTELTVEGQKTDYSIVFDGTRHVINFGPQDMFPHTAQGTGFDTLKDSTMRTFLTRRVELANQCLRVALYPPVAIQPSGDNFQVTYYSVPTEGREQNALLVDPYMSFTVTRRGTVFALRGPSS
jgi:hypothetical protein